MPEKKKITQYFTYSPESHFARAALDFADNVNCFSGFPYHFADMEPEQRLKEFCDTAKQMFENRYAKTNKFRIFHPPTGIVWGLFDITFATPSGLMTPKVTIFLHSIDEINAWRKKAAYYKGEASICVGLKTGKSKTRNDAKTRIRV